MGDAQTVIPEGYCPVYGLDIDDADAALLADAELGLQHREARSL